MLRLPFPLFSFSLIFTVAGFALFPFSVFIDPCIFLCISMAIFTNPRTSRASVWEISPEEVFSKGDGLKVFWVYAQRIFANVINDEFFGYRALMEFIGKTMSGNYPGAIPELTVFTPTTAGDPYPASSGFSDFRPKSFHRGPCLTHYGILSQVGSLV